ncbi:MAG: hypothetical protein RI912_1128 [Actinomycetota bacterium]|jgi:hypothetical protein
MAKGALEHRIENIFEGLFARAFKSKVTPMQIGRRLLQVADSESETDSQGRRVVPNTYIIQLSAEDREGFADVEPALLYELTEALRMHVKTEGYHVAGKARVALRTSTDMRRGRFDILTKTVEQEGVSAEVPVVGSAADAAAPSGALSEPAPVPAGTSAPLAPVIPLRTSGDAPPAVLTVPDGQRVELHEGHYVVGRHLECDIVISDSNVSRRHAEFVCAGRDVIVRDLGSTNGTKVNGVAINGDQLLVHGDVIGFGTAQVTFEAS